MKSPHHQENVIGSLMSPAMKLVDECSTHRVRLLLPLSPTSPYPFSPSISPPIPLLSPPLSLRSPSHTHTYVHEENGR
jgi:hypothetical protein